MQSIWWGRGKPCITHTCDEAFPTQGHGMHARYAKCAWIHTNEFRCLQKLLTRENTWNILACRAHGYGSHAEIHEYHDHAIQYPPIGHECVSPLPQSHTTNTHIEWNSGMHSNPDKAHISPTSKTHPIAISAYWWWRRWAMGVNMSMHSAAGVWHALEYDHAPALWSRCLVENYKDGQNKGYQGY